MWQWCGGRGLLYIPLLLCLVIICRAGLLESQVPAFRDGLAFYYPQAVWLSQRAAEGEYFPTWNAAEALGVSVAGQPSSGLFYPLRIVWLLPFLSVAQLYALFILVHLLIAAAGIRWAAARFGFSSQGQWLAGISYALSCPVVFQHTNLIYLASAAWVGLALGSLAPVVMPPSARPTPAISAASSIASTARAWWWSAFLFALACSLMFLAGDPHTAVNAMLLAGLVVATRLLQVIYMAWRQRSPRRTGEDRPAAQMPAADPTRQQALSAMSWLSLAATLCLLLTAIQWLPAARWSWHSSRLQEVATEAPAAEPLLQRVLAESEADVPPRRIFDFSLPPWYWLTVVWPTLGGHYLPDNSRLFDLLPAEGRMWIPGLYVGLAPWLLACLALFRYRRIQSGRWLAGMLLFATLASLGSYSAVWLLREFLGAVGWEAWAAALPYDPCTSLYWLLTECVPGYSLFRYPAKWSVWIAAALSLLAAAGMDQLPDRFRASNSWIVIVLCGISLLGAILAASVWWLPGEGRGVVLDGQLATVASDRLLGHPTLAAVASSCLHAFLLPALLLTLAIMIPIRKAWLPWITLVEISWVASYWLVFTPAPSTLPAPYPPLPPELRSSALLWCPAEVRDPSGLQSSWLGKLGLLTEPRFLNSPQSIEPRAVVSLRRWLVQHDELQPVDDELEEVLSPLGVTHRLVRITDGNGSSLAWQAIAGSRPMCELQPLDEEAIGPAGLMDSESSEVEYRWQSSDRLWLHVRSQRPVLLLVRQFNDGGWQLSVPTSLAPSDPGLSMSVPAGSLFVQIPLPPGEHQLFLERRRFW